MKTIFSKIEHYKSKDKNTITEIKLNYSDSTYTYSEEYLMKPGDDVGYDIESKGQFKIEKDTVIFYSEMPDNGSFTILNLTDEEILKNKFSYIYPIDEQLNDNQVKIYFDNIAEIEDYKAFTIINNQLKSLKILERKKLEEPKLIETKNDNFFLFHYLIIEKPANNQLIITGERGESFYFDLNKIPYSAFHFFTRAYGNYFDFTGLKFIKNEKGLKLIKSKTDNRYQLNQALNSDFIKIE
ncbi:hypothetical protein [Epilithonimonas zeae]|uniref:hypothetical protein n=1 Tax=Epilithonimonas zeae TaxID=1416779 RepID=UPI0020103514|nr:hypothetical protein [Epilithonimonas zeae]UQB69229.1 hypothetical protein KI430_02005 [Epilithonimonas zeae]